MRRYTLLLTIILMAGYAVGRTPRPAIEQGRIKELKGLTKVFVTSPWRDQSLARKVTETIQKKLPRLNFVDSPVDAEIWLSVFASMKSEFTRIPPNPSRSPNEYGAEVAFLSFERVPIVRGSVMIRHSGRLSRIAEFSKTSGGKNRMAEDVAKEFVRIYEKAAATP